MIDETKKSMAMNYRVGSWFNRIKFLLDRDLRMANLSKACARAYGDAPALLTDGSFSHLGVDGNTLSYRQVDMLVGRLATGLAHVGVGRYDRVGIYKANHADYFLVTLAAMRLGAIAVPVHGKMPADSFLHYARYTGCKAVYTDRANLDGLDRSVLPDMAWILNEVDGGDGARLWAVGALLRAAGAEEAAPCPMSLHDDVVIVHTSGTTGFPKGVLHSSYSLIRAVRSELIFNPLPLKDFALSAAHLNHHIGITGTMLALLAGVPIATVSRFDGAYLLSKIQEYKASIFFAFPDIYQGMCAAGLDRYDLSSMRLWVAGGDAMHEAHIRQLTAHGRGAWKVGGPRQGSIFMEVLGTSEVGSAALIKLSSSNTRQFTRCVGRRGLFSPKVKIADEHGKELPRGEVGRLMVKGASLFKGYWNANEKLHGVMIDGWWWTGDLGYKDRKGQFYQVDRAVDAVATAAGPVYGLPLEEEALKCEDVAEAAVIGLPHPEHGTVPVLVAHSLSGEPIQTDSLLKRINAACSGHQRVHSVIDVRSREHMPRGLTGKVLKRELRNQHLSHFQR
jgi:acyl-coenzyme A synthetase/AMP-(fatty) acid ligase